MTVSSADCAVVKCIDHKSLEVPCAALATCHATNTIKGQQTGGVEVVIKPTGKRFTILLMYIVLRITIGFQWICLGSITNIVANYYGVDNMAIDWLSILFLVVYAPLALPVIWLTDHVGLRRSMLIGSSVTTLGVVIKCFSCEPSGFTISLIGHLFVCFSDTFSFSLSSNLASVWFPDNQVALATSIGLLGEQVGDAMGFVMPTSMVGYDMYDSDAIHWGLLRMFVGHSLLLMLNTTLIFILFEDQPKHAPGIARYKQIEAEASRSKPAADFRRKTASQVHRVKELLGNRDFVQLSLAFGINLGINYAIHSILNQMIVNSSPSRDWEDSTAVVGQTGLILILIGIIGLIVSGFVLDSLRRYKLTAVVSNLLTLLSMILVTLSLQLENPLGLYVAVLPLGFFISCYSCVAFEYAVELTYPKSELISSTLMSISATLLGIPISILAATLVETYGSQATGIALCALFSLSLLLTCLQGGELKRQRAINEEHSMKS